MLTSVPLKNWAVIVPSRDAAMVEKLIRTMQRVANPIKFMIAQPVEMYVS